MTLVTRNKSYQMLMRFLASLKIPIIATLRDSQNFVHSAAQGIGICEMPAHRIKNDIVEMNAIVTWLDRWLTRRLDVEIALELEQLEGAEKLTPPLVSGR